MLRLPRDDGYKKKLKFTSTFNRQKAWPAAWEHKIGSGLRCTLFNWIGQKNATAHRTNGKLRHGTHAKARDLYACSVDLGRKRARTVWFGSGATSKSGSMCCRRRTLQGKRYWVGADRTSSPSYRWTKRSRENGVLCKTYFTKLVSWKLEVKRYLWRTNRRSHNSPSQYIKQTLLIRDKLRRKYRGGSHPNNERRCCDNWEVRFSRIGRPHRDSRSGRRYKSWCWPRPCWPWSRSRRNKLYPHSQHNYSRFESSEERKAKIERFVHNKWRRWVE